MPALMKPGETNESLINKVWKHVEVLILKVKMNFSLFLT